MITSTLVHFLVGIKKFFVGLFCAEQSPLLYKIRNGFYPQSYYEELREERNILFSQCYKEARSLNNEEIEKFCVKKTENRLFFIGGFESDTPWKICSDKTNHGGDDDFSIKLSVLNSDKKKLGDITMFIDNTKVVPKLHLLFSTDTSWDTSKRGYQILDYMNYYKEDGKEWGGYVAFLFGEDPTSTSGSFLLTFIV